MPIIKWKNGHEFVRQVYTPISGADTHLLGQDDRISNSTPESIINGVTKISPKLSVRMLVSNAFFKFIYHNFP